MRQKGDIPNFVEMEIVAVDGNRPERYEAVSSYRLILQALRQERIKIRVGRMIVLEITGKARVTRTNWNSVF